MMLQTKNSQALVKMADMPKYKNFRIYSVSAPSVVYDPQLQIICCYIARYYVRK